MEVLNELQFEVDLVVKLRDKIIMNKSTALLLKAIQEKGSILAACRALKIPYSRGWETIARLERMLGLKVIEASRGGAKRGGASLTEVGEKLLEKYFEKYRKLVEKEEAIGEAKAPDLVLAGSHDPILEEIIESFKEKCPELDIEVSWIGSAGGLASLMLGEADIAGTHLYDEETKTYNIPFLKRYWLEDKVIVIKGFERNLGFVYHPSVKFTGVDDILEGKVKVVNRILGSGTRTFFDLLLKKKALEKNIDPYSIPKIVKGYNLEVKTHYDVAKAILDGKAEVGLTLEYIADKYGLKYIPIQWENYDFAVHLNSLKKKYVKKLLDYLKSSKVINTIKAAKGYRLPFNYSKIIYKPNLTE
ncbi:MAG: hypothetical protein DRN04_08425 [Thermoprotei archaeon]|nr:MAG: hypothetical protein DRN04_08425 [Thermoprotei archaeon]